MKTYTVTDHAPRELGAPGREVKLSDAEAAHPLRRGHIRPKTKRKAKAEESDDG